MGKRKREEKRRGEREKEGGMCEWVGSCRGWLWEELGDDFEYDQNAL